MIVTFRVLKGCPIVSFYSKLICLHSDEANAIVNSLFNSDCPEKKKVEDIIVHCDIHKLQNVWMLEQIYSR